MSTGATREFLSLIRFEHTLFALPYAVAGAFLAARGWPPLEAFLWILVAMVGARTAAMSFNRLVDRKFDATNPRTTQRIQLRRLLKKLQTAIMSANFCRIWRT